MYDVRSDDNFLEMASFFTFSMLSRSNSAASFISRLWYVDFLWSHRSGWSLKQTKIIGHPSRQFSGKHASHGRLAQFIQQHSDVFVSCLHYATACCIVWSIQVHPRWLSILAQHLAAAVKINTSIPLTVPVDDHQYRVCGIASDRGSLKITLRIQLTPQANANSNYCSTIINSGLQCFAK